MRWAYETAIGAGQEGVDPAHAARLAVPVSRSFTGRMKRQSGQVPEREFCRIEPLLGRFIHWAYETAIAAGNRATEPESAGSAS
jgi:hypothetical protein